MITSYNHTICCWNWYFSHYFLSKFELWIDNIEVIITLLCLNCFSLEIFIEVTNGQNLSEKDDKLIKMNNS